MLSQHAISRVAAHSAELPIIHAVENRDDVVGVIGNEHFLAGHEDGVEAGPAVRNDRTSAAGGFEKPHRW